MKQFIELTKVNHPTEGSKITVNIDNITYIEPVGTGTLIHLQEGDPVNVTDAYGHVRSLLFGLPQ